MSRINCGPFGRRSAAETARMTAAAELRIAGATYEQIANQLGYRNHSGAHKAVQAILAERKQAAGDDLAALEDQRLDLLLRKALAALDAAENHHVAALLNAAVRISERRAKLHGLDAPERLEVQAQMDDQTRDTVNRVRAEYGLDNDE